MPKYEGYLMKNSDLVIRRRDDDDTWAFNNYDSIDQYIGFIDTDNYEQAESHFNEKLRWN